MEDWMNKITPIIGIDGKPKGIQVIIWKDDRDNSYDVYRADNTDVFLGNFKTKKELERVMTENKWYTMPQEEGDWFGAGWGAEGRYMEKK